MTVLAIVHDIFVIGGVEQVTRSLVRWLPRWGHEVYVAQVIGSDEECARRGAKDEDNITPIALFGDAISCSMWDRVKDRPSILRRLRCAAGFSERNLHRTKCQIMSRRVAAAADMTGADIVIDQTYGHTILKDMLKVPLVKCYHVNFYRDDLNDMPDISSKYDMNVILSRREWREYTRSIGEDKVEVIPNFSRFYDNEELCSYCTSRILFVGRMVDQKRPLLIVEIFAKVANEFPTWSLDMVGDGPLIEEVVDLTHELGISERVVFHGYKSDMVRHYKSSSIYVMTSEFEGFPLVLLEAATFGMPMVAFDVLTGPSEVIEHEGNGFLVRDEHKDEFAHYLRLLMGSREMREKLGKRSWNKMREEFHADVILSEWNSLLQRLREKNLSQEGLAVEDRVVSPLA